MKPGQIAYLRIRIVDPTTRKLPFDCGSAIAFEVIKPDRTTDGAHRYIDPDFVVSLEDVVAGVERMLKGKR